MIVFRLHPVGGSLGPTLRSKGKAHFRTHANDTARSRTLPVAPPHSRDPSLLASSTPDSFARRLAPTPPKSRT
eukprot:4922999-Prymnesium_polylepis.1